MSTTYLLIEESGNNPILVGYVSLLADSIRITETPVLTEFFSNKGINYHTLPALKIGRLALNHTMQGKGYGRKMIGFSIAMLFRISKLIGCRFLTVDSKKEAVEFYKKLGFGEAHLKPRETTKMYLDTVIPKMPNNRNFG